MPLDAITLHALSEELKTAEGARIDRVQQPEKDKILLALRTREGNRRLLISASASGARVHFTAESFENPAEPPMFCMLLRKHLIGARIRQIEQPDWERMLLIHLDTRDEMGDESEKTLAVEMIGRSANVILVGADGRIIDCLRRMEYGGEGRGVLPGMIYRLPPKQEKIQFLTCVEKELRDVIRGFDDGEELDKALLHTFSGLSPLVCRELAYRSHNRIDLLEENALSLRETVAAGKYAPTLVTLDDAAKVKTAYERTVRKLAVQKEELAQTENREEIRRQAELITANMYRIKKGQSELICENYFEETYPQIHVPLDPLKTPQQNASALYKEFTRKKAAKEHLTVLISEGERQCDYLAAVLDEIERAESERDLADIRRELKETGYLKKSKNAKADRAKPQAPMRFISSDGLEILVGRSNVQNDELSFKLARRTDLWLHVQKLHGSHVVLRTDGIEPPLRSIEEAASLAAYYSQGREAGKVPVDITQIRFVKKPAGSLPGAVLYTDYSTVFVAPDEKLAETLRT